MRYNYDTSEHAEQGRIKVENMNSDVFMLGVKNDDCWPSDMAVSRMEKIFVECNYPHRIKSLVYDKDSHFIGRALTILSWDNPVTAFLEKCRNTALQP